MYGVFATEEKRARSLLRNERYTRVVSSSGMRHCTLSIAYSKMYRLYYSTLDLIRELPPVYRSRPDKHGFSFGRSVEGALPGDPPLLPALGLCHFSGMHVLVVPDVVFTNS